MGLFGWIRRRQRRLDVQALDLSFASEGRSNTALNPGGESNDQGDLALTQTPEGIVSNGEWASQATDEPVTTAVATFGLLDDDAAAKSGLLAADSSTAILSEDKTTQSLEAPIPVIGSLTSDSEPLAAPAPVLAQAQAQAQEVKYLRDPIVDEMVMSLMNEASKRADSVVTAYHTLSEKVSDYAAQSHITARRAWSVVVVMTFGIVVSGIVGSYKLARETSIVENLKEKISAGAAVVAERDQLRTQLSMAHASQFQTELQLHEAQQAEARAQVQLEVYQKRIEAADQSAARQISYSPTTQPAQPKAQAAPSTQPGEVSSAATPNNAWATLLGQ